MCGWRRVLAYQGAHVRRKRRDPGTHYCGPSHACEVEQLRLAAALPQLADSIERAEGRALVGVTTQRSPPAAALFNRAQLVFKRPFGK